MQFFNIYASQDLPVWSLILELRNNKIEMQVRRQNWELSFIISSQL